MISRKGRMLLHRHFLPLLTTAVLIWQPATGQTSGSGTPVSVPRSFPSSQSFNEALTRFFATLEGAVGNFQNTPVFDSASEERFNQARRRLSADMAEIALSARYELLALPPLLTQVEVQVQKPIPHPNFEEYGGLSDFSDFGTMLTYLFGPESLYGYDTSPNAMVEEIVSAFMTRSARLRGSRLSIGYKPSSEEKAALEVLERARSLLLVRALAESFMHDEDPTIVILAVVTAKLADDRLRTDSAGHVVGLALLLHQPELLGRGDRHQEA
ncbi:MAG: hypothetical protein C5B49_09415, partial [Bdellovibrio sp.]